MKYRESAKDKKLRARFSEDLTRAALKQIVLTQGEFRGLNNLNIEFHYPITAIAGRNGAGKSTILALACCAFHNHDWGFKLPKRRNSYYTFSDFFVQNLAEASQKDTVIYYKIAHNNWKKSPTLPDGVGVGTQIRKKKKGGKWNDYDKRVNRTVVFLGIERIVPHSERSQSRSYSKVFKDGKPKGWEEKVKDIVGYILGKTYLGFRYLEHSKYTLPIVKTKDHIYSGFNMGAGENALFEIFSTIYSAGEGALLVMDEVELGLHADAQKKFIEKLKDVCLEMHTQIICTTHSREIFDCLPPDARFFVEVVGGKTKVMQGISSDFAFNKMGGSPEAELEIYLEDDVAKAILMAKLPSSVRVRSSFNVIGSATALARQLAAAYVRKEARPVLAVFDGDQISKAADNFAHAKNMAENPKPDFAEWFNARVCYLPGPTWPESWLLQKAGEVLPHLAATLGSEPEELAAAIEYAMQAGKHNEFFELSKHLGLSQELCLQYFASSITSEDLVGVQNLISSILAAQA
ncbi:ATP-dependent nuclease [Variovorax sp. YR566]|uniref:ATP-dependent nuclease n=1 Tax=Variovorax sp. YR566 TaxID=3450237 RepID=UPI003F7DEBD1